MELVEFQRAMSEKGWVVIPSVIDRPMVNQMLSDIETAYTVCREIQVKNGIDGETTNTVHHLPALSTSFVDFLNPLPIHRYVESFFDGPYILNSFGGALNMEGETSYANRIHRDVRTFIPGFRLMLNTLIMLDDFTVENGATRLLSGSHRHPQKPPQEMFDKQAESAVGSAGSMLIFDSNVWHAAGHSKTKKPRRSVTPLFTRPFVKQQFDYPRALGYDYGETINDSLRQILGYNSRTPANLVEWYQPPEKRMYRPGQG